jgi:hypothetical protein
VVGYVVHHAGFQLINLKLVSQQKNISQI